MTKPWSITTTVRNPLRNRNFLETISEFEGLRFNEDIQTKFQIRLIEKRFYKPNKIPPECQALMSSDEVIDYENAKKIFLFNSYEGVSMRGRQSANPLTKLGFAVARENFDKIIITPLGKKFLEDDYDINYIFLKSLLKMQFPNPWDKHFTSEKGFKLRPFISTLHLLDKINKKSKIQGLTQAEFSIFVPTLNNFDSIDNQIRHITNYRKSANKNSFLKEFAKKFYKKNKLEEKKINNLFDYGDNIMRYFRLTNYFKVSKSHLLGEWRIDLEPAKKEEINQIISKFDGQPISFKDENSYLEYLSDINLPKLPWENKENLIKIIHSYKTLLFEIVKKNKLEVKKFDKNINEIKFNSNTSMEELLSIKNKYININRKIKNYINFEKMKYDLKKLDEKISILENTKKINSPQFKPELFEKLIVDIFIIINDNKEVKPNYPIDEDGEPLSHAAASKPDFECYYDNFNIVGEVTKQQGGGQWIHETVPPQKHLSDFEDKNKDKQNFLLFLAPTIHERTYANFYTAIKGGPYGKQKIIPLSTTQFSLLLKKINTLISKNKMFNSNILKKIFEDMVDIGEKSKRADEWSVKLDRAIKNYKIDEN